MKACSLTATDEDGEIGCEDKHRDLSLRVMEGRWN